MREEELISVGAVTIIGKGETCGSSNMHADGLLL